MADWWTKPSKISQGRKKVSEKLVEINNQINRLFRQYLRANTIERFDELDIREEKVDEDFFLNIKNEIITNRLLYGIDITLHPTDFAKTSPSSPRLEKFGYTPITLDISFTDIINIIESNIRAKIDYSKTHRPIPPPPPPPPPVPWEFIEKTKDLYDLYYDKQNKIYHKVDPATNNVVESEKAIEIDFTISISTNGGNQEFEAEITASITIQEKDKSNIELIIEKIIEKTKEYAGELFDEGKKKAIQRELSTGQTSKPRKMISDLVEAREIKEGLEFSLATKGDMNLNIRIEKVRVGTFKDGKTFKIS